MNVKRTMAVLLSAAMIQGLAVTAGAATSSSDYSVEVTSSDEIIFIRGDKRYSYDAKNTEIALMTDSSDDLLVCFYNDKNIYKGISLGDQDELQISGDIDSLTFKKSLDQNIDFTLGSGSSVDKIKIESRNDITLNGKVDDLRIVSGASLVVGSKGRIQDMLITTDSASVNVKEGGRIEDGTVTRRSQVSGNGDYSVTVDLDASYYDKDDDRYHSYDDDNDDDYYGDREEPELDIGDILAHEGDKLRDLVSDLNNAVEAYNDDDNSISGTCEFSNNLSKEVKSSGSYRFRFIPNNRSKYKVVTGSIHISVID